MLGGSAIGGMAALVAVLLAPTASWGQPDSQLRLVVNREAGTEDCPDASALRARVADVLRSDPFDSDAQATLECTTSRSNAGYAARLVMSDPDGTRIGERELATSDDSCASLADLLELALATAASGYAQAQRDAMAGAATTRPEVTTSRRLEGPLEPPFVDRDTPVSAFPVYAGLGGRVGIGSDGNALAGAALSVGSGHRWLSVRLELQVYAPRTQSRSAGGDVTVSNGSASVVACAHRGAGAACMLGAAGWVRGTASDLMFARKPVTPSLELGVRLEWDLPLAAQYSARAAIEATRAIATTRFTVGDDVVWRTPSYATLLGISLIRRFR